MAAFSSLVASGARAAQANAARQQSIASFDTNPKDIVPGFEPLDIESAIEVVAMDKTVTGPGGVPATSPVHTGDSGISGGNPLAGICSGSSSCSNAASVAGARVRAANAAVARQSAAAVQYHAAVRDAGIINTVGSAPVAAIAVTNPIGRAMLGDAITKRHVVGAGAKLFDLYVSGQPSPVDTVYHAPPRLQARIPYEALR